MLLLIPKTSDIDFTNKTKESWYGYKIVLTPLSFSRTKVKLLNYNHILYRLRLFSAIMCFERILSFGPSFSKIILKLCESSISTIGL